MLEATEETLEIPGRCLTARRWGSAAGPPVLALHGWLDNAASFDALAPLLPELALVALDLPGHGHSDHHPRGQAYHFADWIPVVFDAADALGWCDFAVMGHSLGAGIASLAAGVLCERLTRVVLFEGLGPSVCLDAQVPDKLSAYLRQRAHPKTRESRVYPSLDDATQRLREVRPGLTPAAANLLAQRGMRRVEGGVSFLSDPALRLASPHPFNEAQVLACLSRISAETLLIRADQGAAYDEETMRARLECLQTVELATVRGGHDVHLTHPERVAPLVRRFFSLP